MKDFSRVSKRKKNFCLGFASEMSLFDISEQTDDKIKRISSKAKAFCVKQPAIHKSLFSKSERKKKRGHREKERDRERFSSFVKRSKEGFGLSNHHLVENLSEASPIQLKEKEKRITRLRRRVY